ncbi:hypothetical protein TW86_04755 [Halomonas sp. S2151]|uniref:helix-turn-helix domain-containing protein n=1 Tax=Halomonas sp. S2151 TaxID=579478 RepID=UPI0005F9F6FD|nr:hypothetical protein TW86_04755 [Halomonas sp. S2151]
MEDMSHTDTRNSEASRKPGPKPKVDRQEVIQWRQQNGATRRATAEHFGISDTQVKAIWREAGLSYTSTVPSGAMPKIDPKTVADWRWTRQASIAETARHFGIGRTTVWRACRAHGVDLSHRWEEGKFRRTRR